MRVTSHPCEAGADMSQLYELYELKVCRYTHNSKFLAQHVSLQLKGTFGFLATYVSFDTYA